MALNIQTFKTRALTALLFVAVMLTGLLWNFDSFWVLVTIIHFGCWFEYMKLSEEINSTKIDIVVKWLFAFCGFILLNITGLRHIDYEAWFTIQGVEINLKIIFWGFLLLCLLIFLFQNKQVPDRAKWMLFSGMIYISLSLSLFIYLRDDVFTSINGGPLTDTGKITTCGIIFSIWVNDTMAYLIGSFIGKTPLSRISPKKTWEGTIGGAVLCVLVIGFLYPPLVHAFTGIETTSTQWFIIPALCAFFGTLGDLFESKLKRMADVKDSGSFMPGHGGFLDRFDSLLFAVPAVWVYVHLFL